MPRQVITRKASAKSQRPARKVALTQRGRKSLIDSARSFQPVRRGTKTWAQQLEESKPAEFAELAAMARDFNTGGEWRDHFITVGNFHRFAVKYFRENYGIELCKRKAFADWLDTIGGGA